MNKGAMDDCISAAADQAQQEHTNASPFLLGLYFREMMIHSTDLGADENMASSNTVAASAIPDDERGIAAAYRVFAHLKAVIGVSDAQIIQAAMVDYTDAGKAGALAKLKAWEASPPAAP